MQGFDRQDSSTLGFAVSSLFYGAISLEEFQQWLTSLYEKGENLPLFCVDLLEFNGPLAHIHKVIGFVPDWPFKQKDKVALLGIAFQRGTPPADPLVGRDAALRKLAESSRVLTQFRALFPFVKL